MIHFTNEVPDANPTGREWSADFATMGDLLEDQRIREWETIDPRAPFFRWSRTDFDADGILCLLFAEYGQGRAKVTLGYLSGDREAIEALAVWTPPPAAIDPGMLAKAKKTEHPKHRTLRIPKGMLVRSTAMPGGIDPNLEDTLKELKKRGEKVLGWTVDENRDEYKIKVMSAKYEPEKVDERPRIYVP